MTIEVNIRQHIPAVDPNRTRGLWWLFRYALCHRSTCGQWLQPLRRLLSREEGR
jgi:hypothetical protein